jgi:hypothetical protein
MREAAMLHLGAFPGRHTTSARPAQNTDMRGRDLHSTFRALQSSPLVRLASNGTEHAHVRAVAILGYN